MATEKRLIDANALTDAIEETDWYHISQKGYLEKGANSQIHRPLYIADDIYKALKEAPTVDAVEVEHSRFVNVVDFGDDQGCFGYCERCGSIHHAQHPVALKADYRWCRWCGAKMDGDGNG